MLILCQWSLLDDLLCLLLYQSQWDSECYCQGSFCQRVEHIVQSFSCMRYWSTQRISIYTDILRTWNWDLPQVMTNDQAAEDEITHCFPIVHGFMQLSSYCVSCSLFVGINTSRCVSCPFSLFSLLLQSFGTGPNFNTLVAICDLLLQAFIT